MANFAKLTASDLADNLKVVALRGGEMLCRPYRFEIDVTVEGGDEVDMATAIGSRATLTMQREEDQPLIYHGILGSVHLQVQTSTWSLYHVMLVPKVWQLGLTHHSNIFTKMSVPDIIEKVLKDAGLSGDDYQLELDGSYDPEELVVQYCESKLDFLHRWMEHEGLYYYFEQGDAAEKLTIVDHHAFHDKLVDKKIRYRPLAGADTSAGEALDTFAVWHRSTVSRVRVADYDYARPALDVSSDAAVSDHGFGEMRMHGARFFDPSQAKHFAKLRAEELTAGEVTVHAAGTALHLCAGYLFELSEHPSDAHNRRYLVTEVQHYCNQIAQDSAGALGRVVKTDFDEIYRVEVKALEAGTQYRPPRTTRWPRVWGFENGIVDGPAESEYAQIDEQGRYLVKFQFDESDLKDGKASTYVRMMQPHGGGTEGFHFPLRKNTEVVFTFLGGDPDRPVIAGVVPNAVTPSPVTKDNHTKNIIRTGSGSHITIDDAKGQEYMHLHSPKLTEMFMGGPTSKYKDQHTNKQVRTPPTDVYTGADQNALYEPHPYTWYTYTDGNAGFFVDGDWRQDVDGGIYIFGNSVLQEYYKGPHYLNIKGSSTQWYNDHLKVVVAASEDRDVTGTWDLDATTKAKIHTQAYQLDADNTLVATTQDGKLNFSSKATCNFGNTELNFGPTKLDWKATTGKIAKLTLEIPGGAEITTPKWEVTNPNESWVGAIAEAHWAKKAEFVGFASGATAIKIEDTGVKLESFQLAVCLKGASLESKGVELHKKGAEAGQGGIMAYLKGFVTFA